MARFRARARRLDGRPARPDLSVGRILPTAGCAPQNGAHGDYPWSPHFPVRWEQRLNVTQELTAWLRKHNGNDLGGAIARPNCAIRIAPCLS
jgi:hypothetical protein